MPMQLVLSLSRKLDSLILYHYLHFSINKEKKSEYYERNFSAAAHKLSTINSSKTRRKSESREKMASKRMCCSWCGMVSLVPLEAQSLYCSNCHHFTMLERKHNGNGNKFGRVLKHMSNIIGAVYQSKPQSQSQPQPQHMSPPSHPHGRKRAFLCGISYKESKQSLHGSVNDVLLMKKLLVERFQFPLSSILVLTEEEEDYRRVPTKRNIRDALRWLVEGSQSGDSLVFHYSGHGSQVRDQDGDEVDGYDEALLPVDYQTEGRILDDEINAAIVRPLPRGAMLHAVIDTCFSGTFLDLPNVCRLNREGYYKWEDHGGAYRGTAGGFAVSISACDDHQNTGDTTAFTGTATGALTYCFVQALEQEKWLSYGNLLLSLHKRIGAVLDAVALSNNEFHSSQEPQLSSSHKFDIHSQNFTI